MRKKWGSYLRECATSQEPMKGSDLGRGYTWAGLQKRGVSYEHERDGQAIGRAKERGEPKLARAVSLGRGRSRDVEESVQPVDHPSHDSRDGVSLRSPSHPVPGSQGPKSEGTSQHREAQERGRSSPGGSQSRHHGHEGSRRGREEKTNPIHTDPRSSHRSNERLRILKLAADSLRRQGIGRTLEKPSKQNESDLTRGPSDDSGVSSRQLKQLSHYEKEIAEAEQEKRTRLEEARKKKLEQERKNRSQGRGRGDGFFGL